MNKNTLLAILQQSEYDTRQMKEWYEKHQQDNTHIEPEKWTIKLKLISLCSNIFFFATLPQKLRIATQLVQPLELLVRSLYYSIAKIKLNYLKWRGLKIISIAGTHGKTSTKHILEHALTDKKKILITPKSINTLLGISQVILKDLKSHHDIFIVEFGEYHPRDIPQLTNFIRPHFGILTPIGHQHLSIIGGFEKLIDTFKVYCRYFSKRKRPLLIAEENRSYISGKHSFYGSEKDSQYRIEQVHITKAGTEFTIAIQQNTTRFPSFTPLFGEHQAKNMLTAVWVAQQLQIPIEQVIKRFASQPYIYRRHEPTFADHDILILDNSYNTNPDSMKASLKLLNQLSPSQRVIITLGFVEQGEEAQKSHYQLGKQLVKTVDFIGLIDSPWTKSIVEGFVENGGNKKRLFIANSQEEAMTTLQPHIIPGAVILFEGGYQDLHR